MAVMHFTERLGGYDKLSRMKTCSHCRQSNEADANYCFQCGTALATPKAELETEFLSTTPSPMPDADLWRQFIGPNSDRYLEQFKKFGPENSPRFALTWNWPAFLFVSFLWFLYRKMYLYALVYAIGPMISTYVTGDMTVGIAWSVIAGATANYIYYWHCREQIAEIKKRGWNNPAGQDQALKETGGVQPYVIYVGIAFYVLFILTMVRLIQEGELDGERPPGKPAKPTAASSA
jgi:hypothetical protein